MFGLCIVFWIMRGIFEGAGGLTGGYMPQRYYATRNEREAGLLTAEWIILLQFRWLLIVGAAVLGLSIALSSPEVAAMLSKDPEKTLPVVLAYAIPSGVRGLLVAGLMAAAMSTFDSTINAGVSYWVRDVYQAYLRPSAGSRATMRQSYGATVAFAAVAVMLALGVRNINDIWSWITGPLSAGLFVPLILRWYWWRLNGYGFAMSTAAGLLFSIGLKLLAPDMPFYLSFVAAMSASLAVAVVGSYATSPTAAKTLRTFWLKVRPFGLWAPVTRELDKARVRKARRESSFELVNAVAATCWHVVGVVLVISLVLRKWAMLPVGGVVFVVLAVVLFFTWYKQLPDKGGAVEGVAN
jgi:Na+/proline symporter